MADEFTLQVSLLGPYADCPGHQSGSGYFFWWRKDDTSGNFCVRTTISNRGMWTEGATWADESLTVRPLHKHPRPPAEAVEEARRLVRERQKAGG